MEVREIRVVVTVVMICCLLSVTFGLVPSNLPRGQRRSSAAIPSSYYCNMNELCTITMKATKKSSSAGDSGNLSSSDSLQGFGRMSIMGGMFRGKMKDDSNGELTKETASNDDDDGGFFKLVSRRLPFRKENEVVNGFDVSSGESEREKKSPGLLRMIGVGGEQDEEGAEGVTAKQLAELQRQMDLNRKRQVVIAQQMKRDEEKEIAAKEEEKRLTDAIAKAETELRRTAFETAKRKEQERKAKEQAMLAAEKKEHEKRKQKEQAKLKAERKRDEARRLKEERDRKKEALAADKVSTGKRRFTTTSVAVKFAMNVWDATMSAFNNNRGGGNEEWVQLLPKSRIEPGEIVPVQIRGIDLLVVASRDGKVHCLANACSHMGTPLDTGRLESMPKQDASGQKVLSNTSPTLTVECEDCIVCPLHHTAFALESGEVRGPWCPYPPVLGTLTGTVKKTAPVPTFDIRTKGKFIEVRINSPIET